MNKKVFVYLSCLINGYGSTDSFVIGFGGMLGGHLPGYEEFAGGDESLNDSAPVTPRKPFGVLPSNVPTPKASPKKITSSEAPVPDYTQRLLNGSFDSVVIETPKPSPQKTVLRYAQCSLDSSLESGVRETPEKEEEELFSSNASSPDISPTVSPISQSGSGTSDYVTGSDSASDDQKLDKEQSPLQSKEELKDIYDRKRSYLTGINDIAAWVSVTYKIAALYYDANNNEEYLNVLIGAYNMIHLGGSEYEQAKKRLLISIVDEMYSYIDDFTLIQDPYRAPFSPEYLTTFYLHVDFLLFNHCSFEERITMYSKLINLNVQMKKQHRIDLYRGWIGCHECMLKIDWQISAYENGQPDSGVVQDVQEMLPELKRLSNLLWGHPYCTNSERVEMLYNFSRIFFYLGDLGKATEYRDLFNQWATLADDAKRRQLDDNIQKLIEKEQQFQEALAQLEKN